MNRAWKCAALAELLTSSQERIHWVSVPWGKGIGESEVKGRLWHMTCLGISGLILLRIGILSACFKAFSSVWETDCSLIIYQCPEWASLVLIDRATVYSIVWIGVEANIFFPVLWSTSFYNMKQLCLQNDVHCSFQNISLCLINTVT